MQVKPTRNFMRITRSLAIAFGEKAYEEKLTSSVFRIAPVIGLLMQKYIDGKFDNLLKGKEDRIKYPKQTKFNTAGIDNALKEQFALKAIKSSLIDKHTKAYILVEYLMRMYVNSIITIEKKGSRHGRKN